MKTCWHEVCWVGTVVSRMIVLGIETSCDETAVGVVEIDEQTGELTLLSNAVFSSMDLHVAYGGIVPEIAARSHIEAMMPVVEEALRGAAAAGVSKLKTQTSSDLWGQVDAISVTYGPGLSGSLLVGVMTARTLAIVHDKPLYGVNHVEAHVYANFLTRTKTGTDKDQTESKPSTLTPRPYALLPAQPEFPLLALIVSGKHSQLALFRGHHDYELLGQTYDDAVGEAFDKVAKLLGLPYPGGPSVSKRASSGDPERYALPKPRVRHGSKNQKTGKGNQGGLQNYDFSYSGLKTAVLRLAQREIGEDFTYPSFKVAERLSERQKDDIAASFQRVAIEMLVDKTVLAYQEYSPASVVIAGGVAASRELRRQLDERIEIAIAYPDQRLCTDNGAMIAALGCHVAISEQPPTDPYSLDIAPNLSM